MIPLITSLPPSLSRHSESGEEIGADYQERCIESWRNAGFEPVSVNSASEPCEHPVRVIRVSRDASGVTGRPHVFLTDLLAVASSEAAGGPFAVMNADLLIRPYMALAADLLELNPGEFLFSRRIGIDSPDQTRGTLYPYGYDFFAGHADDILGLPEGGMVFGAPWWDHLFPLLMLAQRCRVSQRSPAVLHLTHEERWSREVWETLGRRFITEAKTHVKDVEYRARLERAITGSDGRPAAGLKARIRRRLTRDSTPEPRTMLHRVSDANLSFLDEVASPADAR